MSPTMAEEGLPATGVNEPTTVVITLSPVEIAEPIVGTELVEGSTVSLAMVEEMPFTTEDKPVGTEKPVEGE